ncbi:MAG: diguanylate cyclase domain-containing protein, partial [Pseudoalteromonas sp.]|uniref:diguanylate cyclase domain-containing protein n=1 Tax=Pseudoalteromonas sp. TaxID=53249 RepID=UPI003F9AABE8
AVTLLYFFSILSDTPPKITVTTSIGMVSYQYGQTLAQTIKAADGLLYQAKNNGRNQVVNSSI